MIRRLEIPFFLPCHSTFKALFAVEGLLRSLQAYSSSHISPFSLFILQHSFLKELSTPLYPSMLP